MKIGSASWVKRGTYLQNATYLAARIDFIELLVYTWNADLEKLLTAELPGLRSLRTAYSIHLPLDSIGNSAAAYSFFKENRFPAVNHTLHPLKGWERFIEGKRDVTLENLIDRAPVYERMTLDVGHLLLSGKENELLDSPRLKEIREFHLHGVFNGRDHCVLNRRMFDYFGRLCRSFERFKKAYCSDHTLFNFEIFDFRRLMISKRRLTHAFTRDRRRQT